MNRARARRMGWLSLPLGGLGSLGISGLVIGGTMWPGGVAHAQLQNGQIQGLVTGDADGKPQAGVTIVVSGPALQEDQVEITGANGRYTITQLPSGDNYTVRFYLGETVVERPGVRIAQNKTLSINVELPLKKARREVKVIRERAPNVDTASANSGLEINQDVLKNTPVRGRTFESVLTLAPGTVDPPRGQGGDVGVSISGSTGNENNFLIDGLNTSDPNSGVLGAELHQYFIKEINVITGGYQAEYGRATGGVVSIITKNGGDELHGSVFGSIQPFQLQSKAITRLGESLAIRRNDNGLLWDVGFELGGPIVKKRLWFFVGFAPTTTSIRNDRMVRRGIADPTSPNGSKRLDDYECPGYLANSIYCLGPSRNALYTEELPQYARSFYETRRLYNGVAKLQFNINADHNISIGYIAAPTTYDGYSGLSPFQPTDLDATRISRTNQVHDVTARYVGKLLNKKLQIDVLYGFHIQSLDERPEHPDQAAHLYVAGAANPYSLADFENVPECAATASFNPCPLTLYNRNGYGAFNNTTLQRHQLLAAVTGYAQAGGSHAFKVGFDFEHIRQRDFRTLTGTDVDPNDPLSGRRFYQTAPNGDDIQVFQEYGTRDANGEIQRLSSLEATTHTNNYAVYVRDSWNISKLPGLVLNLGLRWEIQEIFGSEDPAMVARYGARQIFIWDNIAPRFGAVWDFTQKGLSKLYVNYGRFYQSVPLTINNRQFSGEGIITGAYANDCPKMQVSPSGRPVVVPQAGAGAPCSVGVIDDLNGGTYGNVVPGLKGQFIDEVVAGISYDVGFDFVLGVGYIFRSLGNIIEDMSVDGGNNYLIANPGSPSDPKVISQLESELAGLRQQVAENPFNAQQADLLSRKEAQLVALRSASSVYPPVKRTYHALVISAQKRLSNRFSLLANYTYSRTLGNYPGTFDSVRNENTPNFSSAYDLADLVVNRNGPLPSDRPHNFKLNGTYEQPLPKGGTLQFGLTFTVYSGRPINVLGYHPIYGFGTVFILPRGSGGRTPPVNQLDLHVGYNQPLRKGVAIELFADVINLLNLQAVTSVDDDYSYSSVAAIRNGKPEDLAHLRNLDGTLPSFNPNYGQPTAYQVPLYMRFGGRLSF